MFLFEKNVKVLRNALRKILKIQCNLSCVAFIFRDILSDNIIAKGA